jgi:hypothetical protein
MAFILDAAVRWMTTWALDESATRVNVTPRESHPSGSARYTSISFAN